MKLSERMLDNKEVSLGTVWEPAMTREEVAKEVAQLEDVLARVLPAAEKYYNIGTWGTEPQFELRVALDAAQEVLRDK